MAKSSRDKIKAWQKTHPQQLRGNHACPHKSHGIKNASGHTHPTSFYYAFEWYGQSQHIETNRKRTTLKRYDLSLIDTTFARQVDFRHIELDIGPLCCNEYLHHRLKKNGHSGPGRIVQISWLCVLKENSRRCMSILVFTALSSVVLYAFAIMNVIAIVRIAFSVCMNRKPLWIVTVRADEHEEKPRV